MAASSPLVLIVLDGWGYSETLEQNAIAKAHKPHWDAWWQSYPHTLLDASGTAVGLPPGQMGNSEVGHLHMGAGRLVDQDLTRIDKAIATKTFDVNLAISHALQQAVSNKRAVHILGLLSPGGVHSHLSHIQALLNICQHQGAHEVYLHAFLDGRDTPPQSASSSLQAIEQQFAELKNGQIASLIGRYYAMDRDKRWDRTERAYALLTEGKADANAETASAGLAQAYQRGETDEFVQATKLNGFKPIQEGDTVIFMNFRADRARQLSYALVDPHFQDFTRHVWPKLGAFVTLTQYADNLPATIAFSPNVIQNGLGEYLSKQGIPQLRIAETEKYAHVTFFFNSGVETPYPGEERILIPSPKVATYDLQPEMSAIPLTDRLVDAILSREYRVIICNYANPDMIGHTGYFTAACTAIETIDNCLGRIQTALQQTGGEAIITSDHGNAECMFDNATQQPHTAHTTALVPFLYLGQQAKACRPHGTLADLAPTMLDLLGLATPAEMTGKSLLIHTA